MAAAGFTQFARIFGKTFKLAKSLIDRELQIFSKQCAIDVLFIRFDHRIAVIGRSKIRYRTNGFAHIGILASSSGKLVPIRHSRIHVARNKSRTTPGFPAC
jgi:hypothetical protein